MDDVHDIQLPMSVKAYIALVSLKNFEAVAEAKKFKVKFANMLALLEFLTCENYDDLEFLFRRMD